MELLTAAAVRTLMQAHEPPCISIYQPTHRHHPENQQDPIRFKNLIRVVEQSLREKYRERETRPLLEPLQRLAADGAFWNHTFDGLAVLSSAGSFSAFRVQRPLVELAVVADSFHVKPLLRVVQSADRYQVLCLTRHTARVFEGNRETLDERFDAGFPATITTALGDQLTTPERTMHSAGGATLQHGLGSKKDEVEKDTERYFRAVDAAMISRFSNPSGLPLVLAALPEHQSVFRALTKNAALLPGAVDGNPESLSPEQLRAAAWRAIEPRYLARLASLVEAFTTAAAHQRGTADLSDAARAAVEGRVATLLVESDRIIPGRIDPGTGAVSPAALGAPDVDDLLDDLAEIVTRTGGEVVIVPKERMPSPGGLAATFRY